MFRRLRLKGTTGTVVWGYRTAVVLRAWSMARHEGQWRLSGRVARVDPFLSRQRPLLFTAPRRGGFWAFPVMDLQVGTEQLSARLGPPER